MISITVNVGKELLRTIDGKVASNIATAGTPNSVPSLHQNKELPLHSRILRKCRLLVACRVYAALSLVLRS